MHRNGTCYLGMIAGLSVYMYIYEVINYNNILNG